MFDLLKDYYQKIESIRGKKLIILLVSLFVTFTILGLLVGYFIHVSLSGNELDSDFTREEVVTGPIIESHAGRIEYINPDFNNGVSYVLVNDGGEDIFFLVADDDKLSIADGLFVTVTGEVTRKTGEQKLDTIKVREVMIRNASN
ncbi:hypothetical protein JXA34_04165 [Patescibacteria group bacterium]|nr:hypothetical protein [Patescibacteria group bacterium]